MLAPQMSLYVRAGFLPRGTPAAGTERPTARLRRGTTITRRRATRTEIRRAGYGPDTPPVIRSWWTNGERIGVSLPVLGTGPKDVSSGEARSRPEAAASHAMVRACDQPPRVDPRQPGQGRRGSADRGEAKVSARPRPTARPYLLPACPCLEGPERGWPGVSPEIQ